MEAKPKEKTLTGLMEQNVDKQDDIVRLLTNIWQHHNKQAKPNRILFYVTLLAASLAVATFYYEIVRFSDLEIFEQRIAEARGLKESKLEKLDDSQLLAGDIK